MADALTWSLRFLHILAGTSWVGGAFLWSMVIAPRLVKNGPPAIRRPVMEALEGAVPRFFIGSGSATIVLGILLLGQIAGWDKFFTVLQSGSYGTALGLGLVLAILMLGVGLTVIIPTSKKFLAIMQAMPPGQPPSPETQAKLAALGKKMGIASMSTILLGTIILGTMTWAVNSRL